MVVVMREGKEKKKIKKEIGIKSKGDEGKVAGKGREGKGREWILLTQPNNVTSPVRHLHPCC